MLNKQSEKVIHEIMRSLDIQVGGERPWDVRIHNPLFYKRVATQGSLGLGEAYMDGWWDCNALDELFYRLLKDKADEKIADTGVKRAWKNITDWKIDLQPGMKVLDIGCGWGGFARHAAQNYGAKITGITVSKEQADYAKRVCKGLDVSVELVDYRQLQGTYDRVVSVGMFEHVGWRNYRRLMDKVYQVLDSNGLFLLHTIGSNSSLTASDPWIGTYIFPHSMIPSAAQICRAAERRFIIEDWHNFGIYYDSTLMVWYRNFVTNYHQVKERYDQRFFRMWTYYLLVSAASFRARKNQLWQILFSKKGLDRVFRSEGELFP